LTLMKKLLILFVVLMFALTAGCAASKEYRMSLDFYNKGQYQKALDHIEEALIDDPHNEEYLRLRSRIYRDKYKYRRIFLGFQ
jgi:Tfp pilus assembly protein PilF